MSTVIDTKVAQLKFDNSQFEKGVNQSIKDVEKLNDSLKLDQAADGLKNVSKAIKNVDFSSMADGVENVGNKFSWLHEIATGFARKIGADLETYVISKVTHLAKELTGINNLIEGYSKYESIIDSSNVLYQTQKDLGFTLEDVEERIDSLRWYSDETSYSLSQMTDALSKFTNAGIEIDSAVASIQGIASWAAISGTSVSKASSAFYNLSQAMGTGYLGLMDYKSIENLNMGTMAFKEMALAAGKANGTLKESSNGVCHTADGFEVSVNNFRESLNKKWLDTNVLNDVLNQYGKYSQKLKEFMDSSEKEYLSARDAMEDFDAELEKQGLTLEYQMSKEAFLMGQQAKTFAEAIDATKDAASSAWYSIFKSIIGNLEEAKELWGNFTDELYEIFVEPLNLLDEAFKKWKELGGRSDLLVGISTIYQNVSSVVSSIFTPFTKGISISSVTDKLLAFTTGFKEFAEFLKPSEKMLKAIHDLSSQISNIFKEITKPLGGVSSIFSTLGNIIIKIEPYVINILNVITKFLGNAEELISPFIGILSNIAKFIFSIGSGVLGKIAKTLYDIFTKYIPWANINTLVGVWLPDLFKQIKRFFDIVGDQVKGFFDAFFTAFSGASGLYKKTIGRSKILVSIFSTLKDLIIKATTAVKKFTDRFIGPISEAHDLVGVLTGAGGRLGEKLGKFVKNILPSIESGISWLREIVPKLFNLAIKLLGEIFKAGWKIVSWIFDKIPKLIDLLQGPIDVLKDIFGWIGDHISKLVDDISNFIEESKPLEAIGNTLHNLGQSIKDFFEGLDIGGKATTAIEAIKGFFSSLKKDGETDKLDETNEKLENQITLLDRLKELWDNFLNAMSKAWNKIKETAVNIWNFIDTNTGGALTGLVESIEGFIEKIKNGEIGLLDVIAAVFEVGVLKKIIDWIKKPSLPASISEMFIEIGDSIAGIGESIAGVFDAVAKKQKVEVIDTIATAILKLVGALIALTFVDTEKATQAFDMLVIMIAELGLVAKSFLKSTTALGSATGGISEVAGFLAISKIFSKISTAVIKLVLALKMASSLDKEKAQNGMSIIMTMLMMIRSLSKTIGKSKAGSFEGVGKAMTKLGTALLKMVVAIWLLGSMGEDKLVQGLMTVSVLILLITRLVKTFNKTAKSNTSIDGCANVISKLANAILKLIIPILIFGNMPLNNLIAGAGAVAVIMSVMTVLVMLLTKMVPKTEKGTQRLVEFVDAILPIFTRLSLALIPAAIAILAMGILPWEKILVSGGVAALIMLTMGAVLKIVNETISRHKNSIDGKTFAAIAGGFVIISAALMIISTSILALGILPWEKVLVAGGMLVLVMMSFSAVFKIINEVSKNKNSIGAGKFAGIAAGFVILSAAMAVIAASMVALGTLPVEKMIIAGVIMMAIMGMLALIFNKSKGGTPKVIQNNSLFGIGGSFAAMAAGILQVAAAMFVLSKIDNIWNAVIGLVAIVGAFWVLSKLGHGMVTAAIAISKITTSIALLFMAIGVGFMFVSAGAALFNLSLTKLASALILFGTFGETIEKGAYVLGRSLIKIIVSIFDAIGFGLIDLVRIVCDALPKIVDAVVKCVLDILKALNEHMPQILEELGILIATVLSWIGDLVPGILTWLAEVDPVTGELKGIIADILNWVMDNIPKMIDKLAETVSPIVTSIFNFILKVLNDVADYIFTNKDKIIETITKIISAIFGLIFETIIALVTGEEDGEKREQMMEDILGFGSEIMQNIADGVSGAISVVAGAFEVMVEAIKAVLEPVFGWLKDVWDYIVEIFDAINYKLPREQLIRFNDVAYDEAFNKRYTMDQFATFKQLVQMLQENGDLTGEFDYNRALSFKSLLKEEKLTFATQDEYDLYMAMANDIIKYIEEGSIYDTKQIDKTNLTTKALTEYKFLELEEAKKEYDAMNEKIFGRTGSLMQSVASSSDAIPKLANAKFKLSEAGGYSSDVSINGVTINISPADIDFTEDFKDWTSKAILEAASKNRANGKLAILK